MRSSSSPQSRLSSNAVIIFLVTGAILIFLVVSVSLRAEDEAADLAIPIAVSTPDSAHDARSAISSAKYAEALARQALAKSPIDAEAVRSLISAEGSMGRQTLASDLLSQSALLGWRDHVTQIWLAQGYLQAHDYAKSAQRFDAILRSQADVAPTFDALDQLILDEDFSRNLAIRLTSNPSWRSPYLTYLNGQGSSQVDAKANLLLDLLNSARPPTTSEVLPIIESMVGLKKIALARKIWTKTQRITDTAILDPNFDRATTSTTAPFEWSLYPILGAAVGHDLLASGNSELSVSTDGTASGVLARQSILLPLGRYRLQFNEYGAVAARRAFGWQIRCNHSGQTLLATFDRASPYVFNVPDGCEGQVVELKARADPTAANVTAKFSKLALIGA